MIKPKTHLDRGVLDPTYLLAKTGSLLLMLIALPFALAAGIVMLAIGLVGVVIGMVKAMLGLCIAALVGGYYLWVSSETIRYRPGKRT